MSARQENKRMDSAQFLRIAFPILVLFPVPHICFCSSFALLHSRSLYIRSPPLGGAILDRATSPIHKSEATQESGLFFFFFFFFANLEAFWLASITNCQGSLGGDEASRGMFGDWFVAVSLDARRCWSPSVLLSLFVREGHWRTIPSHKWPMQLNLSCLHRSLLHHRVYTWCLGTVTMRERWKLVALLFKIL